MRKLLFAGLITLSGLQAASALSGPALGFVYDAPSRSILQVAGTRGAATLGAVVMGGVDAGAIAPSGNAALVVRGGKVVYVAGLSSTPIATELGNAPGGPVSVSWSGDSAVVFSAGGLSAQLFSQPNGKPTLATVDLSGLQGPASGVAVINGVLAITVAGDGLYLMSGPGAAAPVAGVGPVSAMAVSGADLFVADSAASSVAWIHDVSGAAMVDTLVHNTDAVAALAIDNGRLFIAAGHQMLTFDLATRQVSAAQQLAFVPGAFATAGTRTLLANRPGAGEPYFFVDLSTDGGVFFVPANRSAE